MYISTHNEAAAPSVIPAIDISQKKCQNYEVSQHPEDSITEITMVEKTIDIPNIIYNPQCRICLENDDYSQLLSPCRCSGGSKYVHERCLIHWINQSNKISCEICLKELKVTQIGYKPIYKWSCPRGFCDLMRVVFITYICIMFVFTGLVTWIASQRCKSPTCIVLYALCATALVYLFYFCGFVERPHHMIQLFLSTNRLWKINEGESSKQREGHFYIDILDVDFPQVIKNKVSNVNFCVANKHGSKSGENGRENTDRALENRILDSVDSVLGYCNYCYQDP